MGAAGAQLGGIEDRIDPIGRASAGTSRRACLALPLSEALSYPGFYGARVACPDVEEASKRSDRLWNASTLSTSKQTGRYLTLRDEVAHRSRDLVLPANPNRHGIPFKADPHFAILEAEDDFHPLGQVGLCARNWHTR